MPLLLHEIFLALGVVVVAVVVDVVSHLLLLFLLVRLELANDVEPRAHLVGSDLVAGLGEYRLLVACRLHQNVARFVGQMRPRYALEQVVDILHSFFFIFFLYFFLLIELVVIVLVTAAAIATVATHQDRVVIKIVVLDRPTFDHDVRQLAIGQRCRARLTTTHYFRR